MTAEDDEIDLPVRHGVGLGILRTLDEHVRENLRQLQMERWGDHSALFDELHPDMEIWVVIAPTLYGAVDDGKDRVSTVDHVAQKDTIDQRLENNEPECVAGRDFAFFLLAFENVETDHDQDLRVSSAKIVKRCTSHYVATRLARDHNERARS